MTKPKKEAKRRFDQETRDAEQGLKDLEEIKSLVKSILVF